MENNHRWPDHLAVGAVRFARPTAQFEACMTFYRDDIGLPVLASWRDHDGYDGMVFGLPGTPVHLELTQHGPDLSIPRASTENQLVLYLTGPEAVAAAVERLVSRGRHPTEVDNPYWARHGAVSFGDPDGWIVILAPWVFGVDAA